MARHGLIFCALAALPGCLLTPPAPPLPPARPPGRVRLFGKEMPADASLIADELRRLIPAGTPRDQAVAALAEHMPGSWDSRRMPPDLRDRTRPRSVMGGPRPGQVFTCPLVGEWGKRYFAFTASLHFGPDRTVREVEVVDYGPCEEPARKFFDAQPGLREPVGLATADAQVLMRSAGFACFPVSGRGRGGNSRPHLFCVATGERSAGGDLLSVRLFCDEAGVVRDTELVREPIHVIRLLGKELPSDGGVIRDELLYLLPPGTPREQAVAQLREHGLERTADPGPQPFEQRRETGDRTSRIYCKVMRPVVGDWGRSGVSVWALLYADAGGGLREIEVRAGGPFGMPGSDYFQARPDLTEPVGLTLAEAEARMRAAGFRCTRAAGTEPGGWGREHLLCEARNDRILLGHMVRVRLFYDTAGVVRDSEVVAWGRLFDAERAMLPRAEDPADEYARRALLFPVHVTSRYAFFTVLFTLSTGMRLMAPW